MISSYVNFKRPLSKADHSVNSDVTEALYAYYNFRDELTVQEQLPVMKCTQEVWESMFWPHMATEMKGYISKCDACMTNHTAPQNETLPPHEFTPYPWMKVGTDLCDLHGQTLLVCDYLSNFTEAESLRTTTTQAVCEIVWSARHSGKCRQWPPVLVSRVHHTGVSTSSLLPSV